jgi:hypothetical protein
VFFGNNGLGSLVGDSVGIAKPFWSGGDVWWVDSNGGGADGVSPAGKDREKPLLTIGQAYTNAAAGDTIVLKDGHAETLTGVLTLAKTGLTIIGDGSTGGVPTVRITNNQAAGILFNITASVVQLRNIYFPTNAQSCSAVRVGITTNQNRLIGCYFDCGANDQAAAVQVSTGLSANMLEGCTFISTASTKATRATRGLQTAGTTTSLYLRSCIFNDATNGFANAALDLSAGAHTALSIDALSLLNGADALLLATGSTWWLSGLTQTGGGKVTIT